MKKIIMITTMLLLFILSLYPAWIEKTPQTLLQPDGTIIEAFATGDEYHNWIHNEEGYTIILDVETGYYCWADEQDGDLVSTGLPIHQVSPFTRGLAPGRNISEQRYKEKTQTMLSAYEGRKYTRTTGNLTNLLIFIKFAGDSEFSGTYASYDNTFNADNANTVKGFFKVASYNQLFVNTTIVTPTTNVIVSYTDTYARGYYLPYSGSNTIGYSEGQRNEREFTLLKNAINAVASQVPTDIVLDNLNSGYIDNVCFIAKGSAVASTILWPHRWVMGGYGGFYIPAQYEVSIHGKKMYDFNLNIESYSNDASTLCHELTHSCGSPDFYRYSYTGPDPVGTWCLMNQNQTPPQSQTSHVKEKYLKWITIPTITKSGVYTLEPITASKDNHSIKILSPNSDTEYFIAEYRYKTTSGLTDSTIPGSGLLVQRINTRNADNTINNDGNRNGPPDELYVYRPGASNNSQEGTLNSAHFSSGAGRTAINSTTNPPPFLYGGGTPAPGGLDISGIGAATASSISFTVTLDNEPRSLSSVHNEGPQTVSLSWTAPLQYATKVTKYNVYRIINDGTPSLVHTTANASTLTYSNDVSAAGGKIKYHVTAVYAAGESAPSNVSTEYTLGDYTDIEALSFTGPSQISSTAVGDFVLTVKNNGSTTLAANTYEIKYYTEAAPSVPFKTVGTVPALTSGSTTTNTIPVAEMLTYLSGGNHKVYAEVHFTSASGLTDDNLENNKSVVLSVENRVFDIAVESLVCPSYLTSSTATISIVTKNYGTTTIAGGLIEVKLYKLDETDTEVFILSKGGNTLTAGSTYTINLSSSDLNTVRDKLTESSINRIFATINYTTASGYIDENSANDKSPVYSLLYIKGVSPVVIGEGAVSSATLPLSYSDKASLSQTIYTNEQIGGNTQIKYLSWNFEGHGDIPGGNNIPLSVYMANTTQSTFEDADSWVEYDDFTKVFEAKLIDVFVEGNREIFIKIDPPFAFNGSNLAVMVNKPLYSTAYNIGNTFNSTTKTGASISAVQDIASFTPETSYPTGVVKDDFPNLRLITEALVIEDFYDIAVTNFVAPTEIPSEDKFTLTIKNQGNKSITATDYFVTYYKVDDEEDIELVKITTGLQNLNAGDTFIHGVSDSLFIDKLTPGMHEIYAIVSFTIASGYVDTNESNNISEIKDVEYVIISATYDIAITDFTAPTELPSSTMFTTTIENLSSKTINATDYVITYYKVDDEDDIELIKITEGLQNLSVGEDFIHSINGSAFLDKLTPGDNQIYSVVSFTTASGFDDEDDTNNTSSIENVEYVIYDLSIYYFSGPASLPNAQNYQVMIKNDGSKKVLSNDYYVSFYRLDSSGPDVNIYTTETIQMDLAFNGIVMLPFNGSLFSNLKHKNYIYAKVDFKSREDVNPSNNISQIMEVIDTTISDNDMNGILGRTVLLGNYPNPFNPSTSIKFEVGNDFDNSNSAVLIEVYNIKGQRIKTLTNEVYSAGSHFVTWNGEDDNGISVSSGMYFYKMTLGDYTEVKKMIMMK